jgi:hypothetical protein
MNRRLGALLSVLMLAGCRQYNLGGHLARQGGMLPPDQYAHYGKEQAEAVAIAREYGRAARGDSPEALAQQADVAVKYARSLPDVADIVADPLGHRLTIRFASGWRVAVNPVNDGKTAAGTPGVGAGTPSR